MNNNNYNKSELFEDFFDSELAYSWTIAIMVMAFICNMIEGRNNEVIAWNFMCVINSIVFSICEHFILVWRQKYEDCRKDVTLDKRVSFTVFGTVITFISFYLIYKNIETIFNKNIINGALPLITLVFIGVCSIGIASAFMSSIMLDLKKLMKGDKEDGDN